MSEETFFNNKSKQWWRIWSCSHCDGATEGNSAETRGKILMAAFDEIYHRGFQAASLNNILKKTNITKGALYYHFKSKMDLGYAVVDEVIYTTIKANWIDPIKNTKDPITKLQEILFHSGNEMTEEDIRLGCPLNNLSQEMSSIDAGFHSRILRIYTEWQAALEEACDRGKLAGNVSEEADSKQLAILFVATLQGCLGLSKSQQSLEILMQCGHGLVDQLELLRPNKQG